MHMISEKQNKGEKHMRLAKKFGAVVATVVVCSAVLIPTIANAQATGCPPHEFSTVIQSHDVYTQHHGYLYGIIDGDVEMWRDCLITTTEIVYALDCDNCEEYISDYEEIKTVTHSECGL